MNAMQWRNAYAEPARAGLALDEALELARTMVAES